MTDELRPSHETQTPIFVLSSGRAGSTLLARMIHAHPRLLCVSDLFEPVGQVPYFDRRRTIDGEEMFELLSSPSFEQRIRFWREQPTDELLYLPDDDAMVSLLLTYTLPFLAGGDPMPLYRQLGDAVRQFPPASPADQLVRSFDWLRDRYGRELWVERTGGSLPHTEQIVRTWPHAKIVHNYRDCRETAISMLTGSFFRLYLELERDPELGEWDWSHTPPVEELGEMLDRWVVDAVEALGQVPEQQRLDLAFEDLLAEPEATLLELAEFVFGRAPDGETVAWARSQAEVVRPVPPRFPELEAGERRRLEKACRRGLELLGYLG